jgi:hypothetical protein
VGELYLWRSSGRVWDLHKAGKSLLLLLLSLLLLVVHVLSAVLP